MVKTLGWPSLRIPLWIQPRRIDWWMTKGNGSPTSPIHSQICQPVAAQPPPVAGCSQLTVLSSVAAVGQ